MSGVKEVVVKRVGDTPRIIYGSIYGSQIYGSQIPYVLGTHEETSSLVKGLSRGEFDYDTLRRHVRDEWGDVSSQSSLLPLALGARLVTRHGHFMSKQGASLREVYRYLDDNLTVLSTLGELAITGRDDLATDCDDLAKAQSILRQCRIYFGAKMPHAQVSLKEGGELYDVSVDAPDGYHFSPVEAVGVLHEAIGHTVGKLRNEFFFRLHDRHDGRYGMPVAVVQYEPYGGERKRIGSLRLHVSDTSIRTRGDSSITVLPSTVISLASGVPLDEILRVNTFRAA